MLKFLDALKDHSTQLEDKIYLRPDNEKSWIEFLNFIHEALGSGKSIEEDLTALFSSQNSGLEDSHDLKAIQKAIQELNLRLQTIEAYIKSCQFARNHFFPVYHFYREGNVEGLEERSLETLQAINRQIQSIYGQLTAVRQQLIRERDSLRSQLPCSSVSMVSEAEIASSASELPPKRVILRLFNRPGRENQKFLGIRTNGHISLELIDEATRRSIYVSLVTNGVLADPDEKPGPSTRLAERGHLPRNLTFQGFFVPAAEERRWLEEGGYNEEFQTVVFDGADTTGLDFEKMYRWARELLDRYPREDEIGEREPYPYHSYRKNCATVVVEGLKEGGAKDLAKKYHIPFPVFFAGLLATPQETLDFCKRLQIQHEIASLQQRIEAQSGKSFKDRWLDPIDCFSKELLLLDNRLINYRAEKLENFQFNERELSLEKLENLLKFPVSEAEELYRITLIIAEHVKRKLVELDPKDTKAISQRVKYFDKALEIIHQAVAHLQSQRVGEDDKLTGFIERIQAMREHLPRSVQQRLGVMDYQLVTSLHTLFSQQPHLQGSTALATYGEKVALETGFELGKTDDVEILFAARGFPDVFASATYFQPTGKDRAGSSRAGEVRETCSTIVAGAETAEPEGRIAQARKVLDECLALLAHSEFSAENIEANLFRKILAARKAIRRLHSLQKADKEGLFQQDFYKDLREKVCDYLAGVYETAYFDLHASNDHCNENDLLIKAQDLLLPGRARAYTMGDLISVAKTALTAYDRNKLPPMDDETFTALQKETRIKKPFILKFWQWGQRKHLVEFEVRNTIGRILNDKKQSPLEKYREITRLAQKARPAAFKFWRLQERRDYTLLAYKAGMVCLLEGFIQGSYSEPMFIELMRHHLKQFPVEPEKTRAFINSFKNKYIGNFLSQRTARTDVDSVELLNDLIESLQVHLPDDKAPKLLADGQEIDEPTAKQIVDCEETLAQLTVNAYQTKCKI